MVFAPYVPHGRNLHPVAGSTKGYTIRSCAQRPDLCNDDPSTWAPGVYTSYQCRPCRPHSGRVDSEGLLTAKVNDKQPNHANRRPACCRLLVKAVDVPCENYCNNDVAGGHANGTNSQHGLSTDPINPQHGRNSSNEHDNANNACCQQTRRCRTQPELTKDLRGVIQHL